MGRFKRSRWPTHAHRRFRHSLKARLVVLFLLLALAMAGAFMFGMQKALSIGWRDAALPLVTDYIDRLTADIGTPPSVERAQALTQHLPISIRISGPSVNWQSQPDDEHQRRMERFNAEDPRPRFWERSLADGHRIRFGLALANWDRQPRMVGWITLAVLLLLTALAYAVVRRLLRPLDDIRAGALRYGSGNFAEPIAIRHRDELGDLAHTVNTMAQSIHQMLEAKRGLLLAISHELRSPITRARLNTELLPESGEGAERREALLRDLQEMADLVTDLLESERLGQGHAALHTEPTDLAALAREVLQALQARHPEAAAIKVIAANDLPVLAGDPIRLKLLLRNLLDNALRHSGGAAQPPELRLEPLAGGGLRISVRDFGPGVDEAALPHLAEPFYRPDSARTRIGPQAGGVGLGLYLCKLVAQAHGGSLAVRNAQPGLVVEVALG